MASELDHLALDAGGLPPRVDGREAQVTLVTFQHPPLN